MKFYTYDKNNLIKSVKYRNRTKISTSKSYFPQTCANVVLGWDRGLIHLPVSEIHLFGRCLYFITITDAPLEYTVNPINYSNSYLALLVRNHRTPNRKLGGLVTEAPCVTNCRASSMEYSTTSITSPSTPPPPELDRSASVTSQ